MPRARLFFSSVACAAGRGVAHVKLFDQLIPPTHERGFRVANIKSQIKRNKQNEKARVRNKAVKSSLRTSVRKFHAAADASDVDAATEAMRAACRQLDRAVSKGVIHKNQAANRKSALAKQAAVLQRG
jgi:small subunit ribosomal protein S20